jgi:hypothetical protein
VPDENRISRRNHRYINATTQSSDCGRTTVATFYYHLSLQDWTLFWMSLRPHVSTSMERLIVAYRPREHGDDYVNIDCRSFSALRGELIQLAALCELELDFDPFVDVSSMTVESILTMASTVESFRVRWIPCHRTPSGAVSGPSVMPVLDFSKLTQLRLDSTPFEEIAPLRHLTALLDQANSLRTLELKKPIDRIGYLRESPDGDDDIIEVSTAFYAAVARLPCLKILYVDLQEWVIPQRTMSPLREALSCGRLPSLVELHLPFLGCMQEWAMSDPFSCWWPCLLGVTSLTTLGVTAYTRASGLINGRFMEGFAHFAESVDSSVESLILRHIYDPSGAAYDVRLHSIPGLGNHQTPSRIAMLQNRQRRMNRTSLLDSCRAIFI